ncbi:MAG: hypothetical protein K2Y05_09085 [Hyphomicrobiaceae bacterium]|nr:hypothetical protein [Hyphomicrobiaceae bacterium]
MLLWLVRRNAKSAASVILLLICGLVPPGSAIGQSITGAYKAKTDIGSGFSLNMTLDVQEKCIRPVAYILVEPRTIVTQLIIDGFYKHLSQMKGGQIDLVLKGRDGQPMTVEGGEAVRGGIERLLPPQCADYTGELLVNIGTRTNRIDWEWAFVLQMSKSKFTKHVNTGWKTGTPPIEKVNADFIALRKRELEGGGDPSVRSAALADDPAHAAIERTLGAQLIRNKEGFGYLIGKLEFGGPAYVAGLRTGDGIVGGGDSQLDDLSRVKSEAMRSGGPNHWHLLVQTGSLPHEIKVGSGNQKQVLAVVGEARDPGSFQTYRRAQYARDYRMRRQEGLNRFFEKALGDRSGSDEREQATLLLLNTDSFVTNRLRLFYEGRFDELEALLKFDATRAFLSSPLRLGGGAVMESLLKQRYAGLIAQYAITKGHVSGACGEPTASFSLTETRYTEYRRLLTGRVATRIDSVTTTNFAVPSRFKELIDRGAADKVHAEFVSDLHRFVFLQGCQGRLVADIEANMLAFYEGRPPKPNKLSMPSQPTKSALQNSCSTYLTTRSKATQPRAERFCSCFASVLRAADAMDPDGSYVSGGSFEVFLEKGQNEGVEDGCLDHLR